MILGYPRRLRAVPFPPLSFRARKRHRERRRGFIMDLFSARSTNSSGKTGTARSLGKKQYKGLKTQLYMGNTITLSRDVALTRLETIFMILFSIQNKSSSPFSASVVFLACSYGHKWVIAKLCKEGAEFEKARPLMVFVSLAVIENINLVWSFLQTEVATFYCAWLKNITDLQFMTKRAWQNINLNNNACLDLTNHLCCIRLTKHALPCIY